MLLIMSDVVSVRDVVLCNVLPQQRLTLPYNISPLQWCCLASATLKSNVKTGFSHYINVFSITWKNAILVKCSQDVFFDGCICCLDFKSHAFVSQTKLSSTEQFMFLKQVNCVCLISMSWCWVVKTSSQSQTMSSKLLRYHNFFKKNFLRDGGISQMTCFSNFKLSTESENFIFENLKMLLLWKNSVWSW